MWRIGQAALALHRSSNVATVKRFPAPARVSLTPARRALPRIDFVGSVVVVRATVDWPTVDIRLGPRIDRIREPLAEPEEHGDHAGSRMVRWRLSRARLRGGCGGDGIRWAGGDGRGTGRRLFVTGENERGRERSD